MNSARIAASAVLVALAAPGYSEVVAGSDLFRGENTSPRRLTSECPVEDDALDPVTVVQKNLQETERIFIASR